MKLGVQFGSIELSEYLLTYRIDCLEANLWHGRVIGGFKHIGQGILFDISEDSHTVDMGAHTS